MPDKLKIALISDELTAQSLKDSCTTIPITPLNYKFRLAFKKPDFLLVESAWNGHKNSWKYKIASYPDYPKRNNKTLIKVVNYAKNLGIPTVFWNKEDGIHFERFIESAKLFEHVFTVDKNCIQKYRDTLAIDVSINTLQFPVQEKIHFFKGFNFKYNSANFVGSYYRDTHDRRKKWQQMLFESCSNAGMQLSIYDRNSNTKAKHFKYPHYSKAIMKPAVSYRSTADIYRDHLVSLNVNTIEDSPTMCSRRLIEVLACGGIAVTSPSLAVEQSLKDFCYTVNSTEETTDLLTRLKRGPTNHDFEMARAGADYIKKEHTWDKELIFIRSILDI